MGLCHWLGCSQFTCLTCQFVPRNSLEFIQDARDASILWRPIHIEFYGTGNVGHAQGLRLVRNIEYHTIEGCTMRSATISIQLTQ